MCNLKMKIPFKLQLLFHTCNFNYLWGSIEKLIGQIGI